LSIYQTLRYRGLSFWQFLRSGETDVDKFTAQRRALSPPRRSRATDPALASVIHAWPKMTNPVWAGILAMVRATAG